MLVHSYRHYLEGLEKSSRSLHKSVLHLSLVLLLILTGTATSFVYFENKKETPIRQKTHYLQKAQIALESADQSTVEILSSFQVAGAKVKIVDNLKEGSAAAAGFFVSLDDLEKSLSKIELAGKNLENQKIYLGQNIVPQKYIELNNRILVNLEQNKQLLSQIYAQQNFAKNILYASGPSFYLPALTDENLWRQDNKEAIIAYYQNIKEMSNSTLKDFSSLNLPNTFKPYYDAQLSYMTLLVNISDKIINILAQKDDPNIDAATQIEKAYAILNSAKVENEKLSQQLLQEKSKIFDIAQNQNKFAQIKLEQNSLLESVQEQFAYLPQTKLDKLPLPAYLKSIFLN